MKDENAPISPDEVLVRLIWTDYYKPELAVPIRDRAFRPRPNESDGISVFRVACLGDPKDALAVIAPQKRDKYVLALVPVSELAAMGLSVQPAKIDTIPGHAVIPELNSTLLTADAEQCEQAQRKLAAVAAKNLIPPTNPKP